MYPVLRNHKIISLLGFLAVVFGAFGSHSLKALLNPEYYHAWQTAIEYHFYHVLALFLVSFLPRKSQWYLRPGFWFIAGILCFSGSLYILSLLSLQDLHLKWLGILTPLGGLFFILGWLSLFLNPNSKNVG